MSANGSAWAGLEMRHLLALVAVVESGTFSAAAEQLGYTQSAVSQQVGTLERMVGAPLFERPGGRRTVQLTTAGEMLLSTLEPSSLVSGAAADYGRGFRRTGRTAGRNTAERRHQDPARSPWDIPCGVARRPDRAP